ncbi:hypothetical protein ABLE68_03305 [Nocardioides sp. CN2-186]|uniref:hypothetical protein n=1 Tax=Nocardioides tweenelious TaxID=3156607 RepID=UPI0032B5EC77
MTTHVTTHNPVRSDVAGIPATSRTTSRAWSFAGIAAGVAGIGTIVTSSMVDVVYRDEFTDTTTGVADALQDKGGIMFAFHSITTLGAVLMVVFAAGLHRRLRAVAPDGLAPVVALVGLAGTAVVSVLGAGLDTEFMMPIAQGDGGIDDTTGAMYNHWIGTIPWCWVLAGLAGLALHVVARSGGVPRWIGRVGLVLGGLTVVLGISPLEYLAGAFGSLLVVVTAVGFTVGDRAFRS